MVEANKRISALAGINLFDDRLNLYAHAEYEEVDEVTSHRHRLARRRARSASASMPIRPRPASTAILDARLFTGVRRLDRPALGSDHPGQQPAAQRAERSEHPVRRLFRRRRPSPTAPTASASIRHDLLVTTAATARLANFGRARRQHRRQPPLQHRRRRRESGRLRDRLARSALGIAALSGRWHLRGHVEHRSLRRSQIRHRRHLRPGRSRPSTTSIWSTPYGAERSQPDLRRPTTSTCAGPTTPSCRRT